jgi:hypothetical protein
MNRAIRRLDDGENHIRKGFDKVGLDEQHDETEMCVSIFISPRI